MSAAQKTVGISSSVAVFLLIVSVCCVLSISSHYDGHTLYHPIMANISDPIQKRLGTYIPGYVPNIALICVMLIGLIAIIVFVCKKRELTVSNDGCQLTRRHDLHRKYSFRSIEIFFIGICTLHLNYLIVEFSCRSNWLSDCSEYFLDNVVLIIFHIVGMVFATFEVIVCWTMQNRNFKPSQWVWHLLAFVLAANITLWFHSVLKESYHRIEEQEESLGAYFSFCYNITHKNESSPFSCSKKSSVARWFAMSVTILFPFTIEFNLLMTETLLDRSIGADSHRPNSSEILGESDDEQENKAEDANEPTDQTPLLSRNKHSSTVVNSVGLKMFTSISVIINTVYLMLSVLVSLGKKWNNQSQYFNDIFTVFQSVYYLLLISCFVVGMVSSRGLKRQQHSHISFLEYLLLFATSGVLFRAVKRIVAFSDSSTSASVQILSAYYMTALLDVVQVISQIVFYYYAKDLKLQLTGNGGNARRSRMWDAVFKKTTFVISTSNFVMWIIDSVLYPGMTANITPIKHSVVEPWPVFDNIMPPIYIFFRFNSALLFCCIHIDLSRPGKRHDVGVASVQRPQETARQRISVGDAPLSSHRPTWPSNRWRSRSGRHLKLRPRKRSRDESTGL